MINVLNIEWDITGRKKKAANKERFDNIMEVAKKIEKQNPDALFDLIKLLGRKLQSDYMTRVFTTRYNLSNLNTDLMWFNETQKLTLDGRGLFHLKEKEDKTVTINLKTDIVLPWPWQLNRVADCVAHIGKGKKGGSWKQDETNHHLEHWETFGISWVLGGNHSIMSGVIQGEGSIKTDNVFNLTELFKHVRYDGSHFIRKHDNRPISTVTEYEFAAIFEIGRLINENKEMAIRINKYI